jgi:polyhydroxyalkanoate synthase
MADRTCEDEIMSKRSEQTRVHGVPAVRTNPNGSARSPGRPVDAAAATELLGPAAELLPDSDPVGFGKSLTRVAAGMAVRPVEVAAASSRFASGLARISFDAISRTFGLDRPPTFEVDPLDKRFADPAWTTNPAFYSLRQSFLALTQLCQDLIAGAELDPLTEQKARMATSFVLDIFAPTNFLPTNPAALKRAFDTGGASVVRGARTFVDDVLHNNGRPRQVDTSSFKIGENLAATACKVVYRNELMELLQYEPQTKQVHSAPLLCSPPWINKFYIMDLAPGRSFIEWAVKQNRTVFAISYVNPGTDMADVTMDDYLVKGPLKALDVIADITGADTIDIVGLCLGGALTAIADAYLAQQGDTRIGNVTLLNTLLDYAEPGVLGVFTETATVDHLVKQMAKKGYLDGADMAGTFDALRPNDLIFNYVVSGWLMGQDPPAFDILAWNGDTTRLPAAMHAFYLRNFYVENLLSQGKLGIAGQQIDLGNIKNNCYVVSAINDHIVPWRSAYATTQLVSGPTRFVLSSGGHIAGIVNPPGPKGWYLRGENLPPKADEWREIATKHAGSWWEDWAKWSAASAGELIDPPATGSESFPVLETGPGPYVRT